MLTETRLTDFIFLVYTFYNYRVLTARVDTVL